jgi:hypothetical protein
MVVERIMPADLELLHRLADMDRTARLVDKEERGAHLFKETKLLAFVRAVEVRVASTDGLVDGELDEEMYKSPRFSLDHLAFASLRALGCVDVGQSKASQEDWEIHTLLITPLGRLVIQAIEELRAGIDAGSATSQGTR